MWKKMSLPGEVSMKPKPRSVRRLIVPSAILRSFLFESVAAPIALFAPRRHSVSTQGSPNRHLATDNSVYALLATPLSSLRPQQGVASRNGRKAGCGPSGQNLGGAPRAPLEVVSSH
jgi:hypothetical protein